MGNEADTIVREGITAVTEQGTPPGNQTQVAQAVENAFADEDAELERLNAAIAAEHAAKTGKPVGSPQGDTAGIAEPGVTPAAAGTTASPSTTAAPAATTAAQAPDKSPRERQLESALIAERRRRQQAEAVANQNIGANRVLTAVAQTGGALDDAALVAAGLKQPDPPKSPEQRMADVETEIVQLEQDYEDGKDPALTAAEKKRRELALMRQRDEIASEMRGGNQTAAAPQNDDLALQEHLNGLIVQHPILNHLGEKQVATLEALAYEEADAEGTPITPDAVGTKYLRERIAALAEKNFPSLAARAKAAAPAQTTGTGGTPAAKPALSPGAQARSDKLELVAGHPPNVGTVGSSATGGDVSDESALATLQGFGGDDDAAIRWLDANPRVKARAGIT